MKWQLLFAIGSTATALEPIGEPEVVDGVWCYTYLSSYLVTVGAETAEVVIPTAQAFSSTQRGILPPYFTNRSTSAFPSTFQASVEPSSALESTLEALIESSEIIAEPTLTTGLSFPSTLPVPTDEEDLGVTTTQSGIATETSTEASANGSEAVSGQDVIFFVVPRVSNERRGLGKRATGGFVGNGNTSNVRVCTNAATFTLAGGQLLVSGNPVYYNGESFKELIGQEDPPNDAVTREFASVAGNLVFASSALPHGEAGFCQDPNTGQVFITFRSGPSGCVPITLRIYQIEQCQDGRIIGLDVTSSRNIESTQLSSIFELTTTVFLSSVSTVSSSIAVGGPSAPTELSSSTDSSLIEASFSQSPSSSYSSSVTSTGPVESSLPITSSIESSISTQPISSTFSFDSSTSLSETSIDLLSSSKADPLGTSTTAVIPTESLSTYISAREVSTESTEPFPTESTSTSLEISTTNAEVTTSEPAITTADTSTTTECDSIVPLTTVALANPTPVFDNDVDYDDEYSVVGLPWAPNNSGGTTIIVSVNGVLSVPDEDGAPGAPENEALKSSTLPPWSLLPYWDDLYLDRSQGHTIVYEVFEGIYGRQATFEWVVGKRNEDGTFHFEAILYEDYPDDMEFRYYTTPDSGGSATVGYQTPVNSGSFVQFSFNQAGKIPPALKLNLVKVHRVPWPSTFDNTECGKGANRV
ncbi:peptidase s8 and s53 subtilisin kexin sedolisin [Fusarium sporotrichioides]|uniref:Peptidase s8 and s53 subtilisin kexin sedolisin n=1 Tax=Fusarium sporotrichioides TaxID=5514 RepID=A0A395RG17_FUSSP|nr:peptidase s8 and s53 subtilisin kexin sedolisin [Fusarium sporotrichioides]